MARFYSLPKDDFIPGKHGALRREWYFRDILTFVAPNNSKLPNQYLDCMRELLRNAIIIWRADANDLQISMMSVLLLYLDELRAVNSA